MLQRLAPYAIVYLILQQLTRATLLFRTWQEIGISALDALGALAIGLWYDACVLGFILALPALHFLFTPARAQGGKLDRRIDAVLRFLFVFVLLFTFTSEHIFWTEFSTRFNFIAVDYLIYTQEVLGNITESYPVGWVMAALAIVSAAGTTISLMSRPLYAIAVPLRRRLSGVALLVAGTAAMISVTEQEWTTRFSDNAEAGEVAANGIYNLFYAFGHNEIDFEHFYATASTGEASTREHQLTGSDEHFIRHIRPTGKELRKNVVLVAMESMSADFMASFGNGHGLTPNLDRFAHEGMFFTNLFATGTRTVRGLEALTLSTPPTPGQSIIRRPGNENLYSLGFIFKDRGYQTTFLYGGYGYFDNMNAFFSANGFDVVDRVKMTRDEIHFANVWGVADDDVFARAVKEADAAHATGKPFMQLIMTTSNHRPYTYPEGRIDIPSKSGREGGVKYADYSVGKLVEWAKTKPWFDDTVFIFIADHTAGGAGKTELDPKKYHIPMVIYSPSFIKPQRVERLTSQIDVAPTLLGLLNFSYDSKFFGEDVFHDNFAPRAYISNYQKVALVENDVMTILSPKHMVDQRHWPDMEHAQKSPQQVEDTIALYQSASWWRENDRRIPTLPHDHPHPH